MPHKIVLLIVVFNAFLLPLSLRKMFLAADIIVPKLLLKPKMMKTKVI